MTIKTTYSNNAIKNNLVMIKEDNSYVMVGDFDLADEDLWDMADGFDVDGWHIVDLEAMARAEALA